MAHDNSPDIDEMRRLLSEGAPEDIKNENGQTALMYAVMHRNLEMVKLLLEVGADTEVKWSQGGHTALQLACGGFKPPNVIVVQLLLDHGANPHTRDNKGRTLVHSAVDGGNEAIMKLIAQNG